MTTDSYFSTDFFVSNRRRLRELFTGTAPIVLAANGLMQRGGDNTFAFSQDPNFWYFTGIDEPDLILVMDRDKEYLIVPGRSQSREAFDGSVSSAALTRRSGIESILDEQAGWDQLGNRIKKVKHFATIAPSPAYIPQYGMFTNPARSRMVERIKTHNEVIEILDLSLHVARMRMIKQPEELQAIQAAINTTIKSLKHITRPTGLAKYAHEYEIEADLSHDFRSGGAAGHAFAPIVASGERAVTLHYIANQGKLASGELLVLDVGAEVEHYAADITRTVSLGQPSRRQQAVYDAVLETQAFAFGLIKPGIDLHAYEKQVAQYLGEKMRELGLIKIIEPTTIRQFCPHAVSHFMGLTVHDAGDYDRPLEAGVVMTVEPGIYIAEEGIGVRIEDDVLVTENGCKILTDKLPRRLA